MTKIDEKIKKVRAQGWDIIYDDDTQALAWVLPDGKKRYIGGPYTLCEKIYRKSTDPYIFLGDASAEEFYARHSIPHDVRPKDLPSADVLETDPIAVVFRAEELLTMLPEECVSEWQEHFAQIQAGYDSVGCVGTYNGYQISQTIGTAKIREKNIELGLTAHGNWAAEDVSVGNGDDVIVTGVVFRNQPDEQQITTSLDVTRLLESIAPYAGIKNLKRECWECKKIFYWWDVPGDYKEKLECYMESYCNTCG